MRVHKVHICPNPTDPAILVESRRNAPFLKFIDRGPDETVTEENTLFMIDSLGHIHNFQLNTLTTRMDSTEHITSDTAARIEAAEGAIQELEEQFVYLQSRVVDLEVANRNILFPGQ